METTGQFLSPIRQARIRPVETAARMLVGFAEDYPAGLRTGMHAHPRAQLILVLSGVMRIATPREGFLLPPGLTLLLPAGTLHDVEMEGKVQMRALFLREKAAQRIGDRAMVLTLSPLLRELILAACREPLDWALDGRGRHIAELALDEAARARRLPLSVPLPRDARLAKVATALQADPACPRTLEDWSETAGASSRTLARLIQAETGMSFRHWRLQMRLAAAVRVLASGGTPKAAAAAAGFDSVPAFGAAFRRQFAMTPGQARALFSGAAGG